MTTIQKIDLLYIIDDDDIIVYLTDRALRKNHFSGEIKTFSHGLEALNNLKQIAENGQTWPDVILLDLNMPIMNGWQFIEEFIGLDLPRTISLFIFSSSINRADQDWSLSYPAHIKGYITKPLVVDKLNQYLAGSVA